MDSIGSMADAQPAAAWQRICRMLMLAVLVAVSGCGAHRIPRPAADQPLVAAGRPAPVSDIRAAEALLTDGVPALRQQWNLGRAQQQVVAGCMRHLGHRYLTPSAGPAPAAGMVTDDAAGPRRPATYGVPPDTAGGPGRDREDAYIRRLPGPQRARYNAALLGAADAQAEMSLPGGGTITYGTGGCLGDARRQLFGSVLAFVRDAYIPQVIKLQFGSYLTRYRPYTSALRRWQQCMASAGRRYASPESAMGAIEALASAKGTTAPALEAAQRAVAGADATCDGRSGLRLRRHDGLIVYVHMLPGRTLAGLRAIYLTRREALRAALRELGISSGRPR